ncbi:MAG: hypothetical protein M1814_004313 [Vezdaea aestivalis]|nr:MAG: hypothetical protein M1814_004313 [Vezdaea aestivalis]
MSGLARKILILATIDGLVLQPLASGPQKPAAPVWISYGPKVSVDRTHKSIGPGQSLECYGIAGFLNLSSSAFLIAVSNREQVASIRGHPIYALTGVTLIPLSSFKEAGAAISQHSGRSAVDDDRSSLSLERQLPPSDDELGDVSAGPAPSGSTSPRPGILETVVAYRGTFGQFSREWIGLSSLSSSRRRSQSFQSHPNEPERYDDIKEAQNSRTQDTATSSKASEPSELLPKLLKTVKNLLLKRNFYFSYDYDLTRSILSQHQNQSDLPLHKRCDKTYFWNAHMMAPLGENGENALTLPLIQGFVGQSSFTALQSKPVDLFATDRSVVTQDETQSLIGDQVHTKEAQPNLLLTLISRRSIHRPGLRYLRRGVDEAGNVANFVETEQILSSPTWSPAAKVFSYTQIRGSIPLFFSQTPYAFKPSPQMHHSFETNHQAFSKHLEDLWRSYDTIKIVSLLDKGSHEAILGKSYQSHAEELVESGQLNSKLSFNWFDFHAQCRGMKYDNISILVNDLRDTIRQFGETVEVGGELVSKQQGIIRTNCMDCLDRTGVASAAFGQDALKRQLLNLEFDPERTLEDSDARWFNNLWADNGDAISRQYSSTAALKGDYTRTRKRDYHGALRDLSLTLSRYYNNIVNDYFAQATIDFLLGTANSLVFQEFEAEMSSMDPAISVKALRQRAVENSRIAVISEFSEDFLGGWSLLTPSQPQTLRTTSFCEIIFLLTTEAIYLCQYDWNLERVSTFRRINLLQMEGIRNGTYITSTYTASQMDEVRNFGFVLKYTITDLNKVDDTSSALDVFPWSTLPRVNSSGILGAKAKGSSDMLAFKALPAKVSTDITASLDQSALSEKDVIRSICSDLERALLAKTRLGPSHFTQALMVEEKDIVSLDDARRGTGLLELFGHYVKTLVWA